MEFTMKKLIITIISCILCLFAPASLASAQGVIPVTDVAAGKSGELYGIGSVSKVFTAAAVMKLVDEGKIDLDKPLTAYIPEFVMADERYMQITPRMLLNHSSGLMGMTGGNTFLIDDNDTYSHDHFLEILSVQTLKHDPGDRSIYCNDGFTLAEILVEHVSGMSFTDFIENNFSLPLGLKNIKTPQSNFDRGLLAGIYMGGSKLKPQILNSIGTGGMYATMEDLCKYAAIFMDSADGSVISKKSIDEMAKNQHKKDMTPDAQSTTRYGLGWDGVDTFPFSDCGIKALNKGGNIGAYNTNLTVLPEYNLAAAVSSSAPEGGLEILIAQEILLAVLEEEGLLPNGARPAMPAQNLERDKIPERLKAYAGLYDTGAGGGLLNVEFTDDTLVLTPIAVRNERPQVYIYNTDGEFISTNGDYIFLGLKSVQGGERGVTTLHFAENKYIISQTYMDMPGLSQTAMAMPIAEKLEPNTVSDTDWDAWKARNHKEYLMVSEKYSSLQYASMALAKILADGRARGYVGKGIYESGGSLIKTAKIVDDANATGFQDIPTMPGRDTNNIYFTERGGIEYLGVNNTRFIDATAAKKFSELGETVTIGIIGEPIWVDIDSASGGRNVMIAVPKNGSWFAYDDKMNCIATSLEKNPREIIILPENGRLVFAGEAGAEFALN